MFAGHFRPIKVRTSPGTDLATGDPYTHQSPGLIRADPDGRL
jgi:hypothetical protein